MWGGFRWGTSLFLSKDRVWFYLNMVQNQQTQAKGTTWIVKKNGHFLAKKEDFL